MPDRTLLKQEYLSGIFSFWDMKLKRLHPQLEVSGSPERTQSREVLEDEKGNLFVLEEIHPHQREAKLKIIEALEFLKQRGFTYVLPYQKTLDGKYIISHKKRLWQLVPYVKGVPLNRPDYVFDKWRGPVLAEFLVELKSKGKNIPFFSKGSSFSIKEFIYDFIGKLKQHNPELLDPVQGALRWLESDFFREYNRIPLDFCHGDYHPLNVIWGDNHIKKVIDWEFLGYKPEIYDLANMIGCIGMEDPPGLEGELIIELLSSLRRVHVFTPASWDLLFPFIVAMRFAWLSEWLRKNDREMVSLELVYINLLIERHRYLTSCWGI